MTKPSEVTTVLTMAGYERGTARLLTELFERMEAHEQNMQELAIIQLEMTKQISQVVDGAGNIRAQVEKITRRGDSKDDLPPTAA